MRQINGIGAAGLSPPCDSAAGGVAAPIPGTPTKWGERWSDETVANVREWAESGLSTRDVANKLGVSLCIARYRATALGIKFTPRNEEARAFSAAAAVLREHYGKIADTHEVLRLYTIALGKPVSLHSMYDHAGRIGVTRNADVMALRTARAIAGRILAQGTARAKRAAQVQELLDTGMLRTHVAIELGFGDHSIRRMLRDGLITEPPRPVKIKQVSVVRIKPVRMIVVKPPKPRPPMAYKEPEPPKLIAVYQTVDAWLAAGNVITRCPTAMLVLGQATIPEEDRAALRAYHDARDAVKYAAGDAWRQRAHKKSKQKEMTA